MTLIERLEDRTRHPWIALILSTALLFLVVSALSQALLANDFVAGFFAVYAVLIFGVAVFAFCSSQFIRFVSTRKMGNNST